MSASVRLEAGTVFAGDYKVVRPLAEGTERAVYVAEQVSTGREVALKIIAPELVPDEASKAAFSAEVRAGGKIQTEHLVDVRASGIDAATGFPWLAMELLEGEDLAKTLADHGKPQLPDWDEVLSQVCRGLGAVHAAGAVHGAIKPETVFLAIPGSGGERFRVELLDFGIPRVARDLAKAEADKIAWMAPEQIAGEKATAASDVWAVGLLAFRMIAGKHYFKAANAASIDAAALQREIAESTLEPATARAKALGVDATFPAGFDAWFARCVARAPGDRFPDANAALDGAADVLAEASGLEDDVEEDREPRVKPPPLPPMVQALAQNPKPAIIAIVLLVGIALTAGFGLGAIFQPAKQKDARARADVFARGDKAECEKACDSGDATACHGLGLMYLYGLKVTRDEAAAAKAFERACSGGDMPGCGSLAARYLNGEGVPEDKRKASDLYRRACDRGDMVSCIDLADMFQNGNGVPKDEAQAQALKDKACKEGFTEVCR